MLNGGGQILSELYRDLLALWYYNTRVPEGPWLVKLHPTPLSILHHGHHPPWHGYSRVGHHRRIGWPSGLCTFKSYSVQLRLPQAASMGPLGWSRVFFYWNPPSIIDKRASLSHSSQLSYSYCMDHHLHHHSATPCIFVQFWGRGPPPSKVYENKFCTVLRGGGPVGP